MNISLSNLKKMDTSHIFDLMLPLINFLFNENIFMNISQVDYYNFVKRTIDESKTLFTGDISYEEYLTRQIQDFFSTSSIYTRNSINNDSDNENIIDNDNNINNGDINIIALYLKAATKRPVLSFEEEQCIFKKIKNGDINAKKIFIESNLRLVINIAKKYKYNGVDFLDLIQEGNLGLLKAVDRFDPSLGYRFSTYATFWISKLIDDLVMKNKNIVKIPYTLHVNYRKFWALFNSIENQCDRRKAIEVVAEMMEISKEEANQLYSLKINEVSLNTTVFEDSDELEDMTEDVREDINDIVEKKDFIIRFHQLLHECHLTERELEILKSVYGLDGRDICTFAQLSRKYNISGERVRQIEASAIRKIRMSGQLSAFADYMDNPARSLKRISHYMITPSSKKKHTKRMDDFYDESLDNQLNIDFFSDEFKIISLKSHPMYIKMVQVFDETEALVLLLKLGFIKNYKLSVDEINKVLCIPIDTIQTICNLYHYITKDNISQYLGLLQSTIEDTKKKYIKNKFQ